MRKKNESYSVEKKIEIIKYYRKNGPTEMEKRYNIDHSVFQKWERIWVEEGEAGLALERRGRGTLEQNDARTLFALFLHLRTRFLWFKAGWTWVGYYYNRTVPPSWKTAVIPCFLAKRG